MAGEFCFALRCQGTQQKQALKRQCSKCMHGATYVPSLLEIPTHQIVVPIAGSNGKSEEDKLVTYNTNVKST